MMTQTISRCGATVAPAGCCAPVPMKCTLILFVNGQKPTVIAPYIPIPEMRSELYVWTEKGEVHFTEDAAWDHYCEYDEWPRKYYYGEDPNKSDVKVELTQFDAFPPGDEWEW